MRGGEVERGDGQAKGRPQQRRRAERRRRRGLAGAVYEAVERDGRAGLYFWTIMLNNQAALVVVAPDDDWLDPAVRARLEESHERDAP